MGNPSGDSTIHDLPVAANINGSEEVPADQVQGSIRVTVKIPLSGFAQQGLGLSYGTTGQRPGVPFPGQSYFDTTLGFLINWSPTLNYWVDSAGYGPM